MDTRQNRNRVRLYKGLKVKTPKKGSNFWNLTPGPVFDADYGYDEYLNDYFTNQKDFDSLYYKLTKTILSDDTFAIDPEQYSLEGFYDFLACDLEWAKGTQPCIAAAKNAQAQSKQQVQPQQPKQPEQPQQPKQQVQPEQPQAQQQSQPNERPKLNFHQCQGTYTPGCVNTDAIAQVQRCLDLTTPRHPRGSGYYDYILHDKLSALGFKNGFTDADVSKICDMESTKTKPFQAQESDTPGQSEETPRQTYEKYYAKLDGKETGRVKLKLNNIPDNDLQNLNKYFATQGLYKIKNPKRRYGTKFVWGKKP